MLQPLRDEPALAAALRLFDERGYEAAPVADIRRRAGLSNGSFFHRYGSKAGMAGALYLALIDDYQSAVADAVEASRSLAAGLRAGIAAHADWVAGEPAAARFLFRAGLPRWDVATRTTLAARNRTFLERLVAWRARFAPPADAPAPELFVAIWLGPSLLLTRRHLAGDATGDPAASVPGLADAAVAALAPEAT